MGISKNEGLNIEAFRIPAEWRNWLAVNTDKINCVWVRFFKKNSGVETITYSEALDEALCYGWIDGQVKKFDDKSWIQKFTPRRPKSMWSKKNREHVARLKKEGKMTLAGLKKIEEAKKDGRWQNAYDSPANMKIPQDFLKKLSRYKKAKAFFDSLNKTNLYAIAWRLQTAKKPETRKRRMETILQMMKEGKKIY